MAAERSEGRGKQHKEWYRLDNAAVVYSAIQKENYSAIYRFSAVMEQPVDPEALQRAVDKTMPRFPGFRVRIKQGLFWYYSEFNDAPGPFVKKDIANPCQPVRFDQDDGWLVRFYYYEKRISMEVFHAISDGGGALYLLRTLLAVYLRELGHEIPNTCGVLDVDSPPRPEELEDAYARYATVKARRSSTLQKAYQNRGTAEPFYTLNVTMGFCSVRQLKERAKRHGASITEYLTAVLLKVLMEEQHRRGPKKELPVAVAIPINLRSWFPTESLRNFILTVRPSIDPSLGEYTFEEIISQVHHYLRLNINRQQMQAELAGNVKFARNKLIQVLPVWFKKPLVAFGYRMAECAALFRDLHQSGPLPGAGGDAAPHPADGGHSGSGHHATGPLRLHQLWRRDGDHLCRDPEGVGYGAGIFPLFGAGRDPRQGGEQPYPVRRDIHVVLCTLWSGAGRHRRVLSPVPYQSDGPGPDAR